MPTHLHQWVGKGENLMKTKKLPTQKNWFLSPMELDSLQQQLAGTEQPIETAVSAAGLDIPPHRATEQLESDCCFGLCKLCHEWGSVNHYSGYCDQCMVEKWD